MFGVGIEGAFFLYGLFLALFGDGLNEEAFVDVEEFGAVFDVDEADDFFGDEGDGFGDFGDDVGFFAGVVFGFLHEEAGFEADEVGGGVVDVFLEVGGGLFSGVGVGVFAFGEEDDFDVEAGFEEEVDAADGGFDACVVAVVEDGYVVGEASDEADLALCEGGSAGGDDVFEAGLVHGDDVGKAFYEKAEVVFDDGGSGEVDAVEFVAFVVDFAFGGVDVFGEAV